MRVSEIVDVGGGHFTLRAAERPVPVPRTGEVLIRVHAAGVNGHDVHQVHRGGHAIAPGETDLPGLEVSGTIVAVAEPGGRWQVGDRVCALMRGGGYAEHAVAAAALCLPIPAGVGFADAASLPETFFTVWSNVMVDAALAPGESFLMNGGTSGIGVTAIQLFAALGHPVYATARGPDKAALCRELGAVRAIDYEAEDFVEVLIEETGGKGVDVILDIVGGDYLDRDLQVIAHGGRVVFIGAARGFTTSIDIRKLMYRQARVGGSLLRPRPLAYKRAVAEELEALVWPLIAAGRIRPVVDRRFALADAGDAIACLSERQHIGKVVLQVED
ncbi:MAG TPA: NAD(P)H-quinone oxidoreductase [Sphingomonas sp.]|nr:NAD(P)H-quinone oxidoreductase [Sphingomonas sp.]